MKTSELMEQIKHVQDHFRCAFEIEELGSDGFTMVSRDDLWLKIRADRCEGKWLYKANCSLNVQPTKDLEACVSIIRQHFEAKLPSKPSKSEGEQISEAIATIARLYEIAFWSPKHTAELCRALLCGNDMPHGTNEFWLCSENYRLTITRRNEGDDK